MISIEGPKIESVAQDSPAMNLGIREGDYILSVDDKPINDFLDLQFYAPSNNSVITWFDSANQCQRSGRIFLRFNEPHGIELYPFRIKQCKNNCVFCFVRQLPRGMRKELYIKDEDFRLSFLFGNYITGSNLNDKDIERIIAEKLSPIYISIHATDRATRSKLLGNNDCIDIIELLTRLKKGNISYHGQIVLCPNYNDGDILSKTMSDLSEFYPNLLSVAIVPVGLTDHRSNLPHIERIDSNYSKTLISSFRKIKGQLKHPEIFYLSDEFYLQAGIKPPMYSTEKSLPQFDNGIGMYAEFYKNYKKHLASFAQKHSSTNNQISIAVLTSILGASLVKRFKDDFSKACPNISLNLIPVINTVFGKNITVSGLLCGRDFVDTIIANPSYDYYIIPRNSLRTDDNVFLDDMSLSDVESFVCQLKKNDNNIVLVADDTAKSFLDVISGALIERQLHEH